MCRRGGWGVAGGASRVTFFLCVSMDKERDLRFVCLKCHRYATAASASASADADAGAASTVPVAAVYSKTKDTVRGHPHIWYNTIFGVLFVVVLGYLVHSIVLLL